MYASVVERGQLRWRILFALVVCSSLPAAPVVASEIFKCVAKDGSTPLYQNFPCDIDSVGSLPSDPPAANTPPLPAAAVRERSKTAGVNVSSPVKSAAAGEPRIGMTSDEVRTLLGEPEEMVDDEPAEGGRISIWRYADGRTVQFDHKHRVSAVQR